MEYTEDQILDLYIQTFDNVLDAELSNEENIKFFQELSKVEGISEYLRSTMGKDIQRYFMAQDDVSRANVKGAYARTMYFKAMLKKVRDMSEAVSLKKSRTKVVAQT